MRRYILTESQQAFSMHRNLVVEEDKCRELEISLGAGYDKHPTGFIHITTFV
jgi:hypothetical protein